MALPQDLLVQIFSWLPGKTIFRCSSICKSLSESTAEKYFALKQCQNMFTKGDTCFFLQPDMVQSYNEQIELLPLSLHGEQQQLYSGVPCDVLGFLSNSTRVLDSCNGLILCRTTYNDPVKLFVCNPATQSRLFIPLPRHLQRNLDAKNLKVMLECRIGSSLDSDDYKVIHFEDPIDWESSSYYVCNVYHLKDRVWKSMEKCFFAGPRRLKFDMPVRHDGSIHFISDCFPCYNKKNPYFRPYIMSYNLENGNSRMLRVPKEARRGSHDLSCEMSIFKWSNPSSSRPQSICLVRLRKSVFTIWVLRDYETSLWCRILKVRVKAMGLKEQDPKVSGFSIVNGDVLIFSIDKKVYSYGLIGDNYMRLEVVGEHQCDSFVCFTSYSNTLRPCGTGATTMPCKGRCTTYSPGEENIGVESYLSL